MVPAGKQRKGKQTMTSNTSEKATASETNKPPVAKLRIGLIFANIWQRTTDENAFYSVSFERRYRDTEGNWQSTYSFDTGDLLALAKLADQAHSKILEIKNGGDE
jgi:hypothetical protein